MGGKPTWVEATSVVSAVRLSQDGRALSLSAAAFALSLSTHTVQIDAQTVLAELTDGAACGNRNRNRNGSANRKALGAGSQHSATTEGREQEPLPAHKRPCTLRQHVQDQRVLGTRGRVLQAADALV